MFAPLIAALCLLAPAAAAGSLRSPATSPAVQGAQIFTLTPKTVQAAGSQPQRVPNSIAWALERAGPGSVLNLTPGDYDAFSIGFRKDMKWNARAPGGAKGQPVTILGQPGVRILPRGGGDTIAITQEKNCGWFRFENLEIVPGYRAGVMFYKGGKNTIYEGFHFVDCNIVGSWDHLTKRGGKSKWGVWGHSLSDFVFRGSFAPARVENIRAEHAFYLQNSKGDVTIENVHGRMLGRTFVQLTARPKDGDPAPGKITVRNCLIEDPCIAEGDNFKGGSAISLFGRHTGEVLIEGNRYRAGFDPRVRRLTRKEVPYGTGAVMITDFGGPSNGHVILKDNDFEIAPGCGDRPLVSIGGCKKLELVGTNRMVAGAHPVALELDPADQDGGRLNSNPIGRMQVAAGTIVQGDLRRAGEPLDESGRRELTQGVSGYSTRKPEARGR